MALSPTKRKSQELQVLAPRYDAFDSQCELSSSLRISDSDGQNHRNSILLPFYPESAALALLMVGICLAAFLVALDRTIVATAIPRITDDFKRPSDIGWYGSAYLLTSCAFLPTYGRIFVHFDVRWPFLVALGLFELGSLVCGLAPSSTALVLGRTIAGLGCAGVFAGVLVIITHCLLLAKRPIYMALVGSIYA